MLTRRDLTVAAVAAAVTLGGVGALNARTEILGSRVFDWNDFKVEATETGSTRKVIQQPTATLDELEIHITTLNPGETPHAPHRHPDEELLIVKEGTVESLVNGELKRVGPGSVIFQAANQLHSIRNVGSTPATYHVIKWNSPGMKPPK
jgi:XRE family transcriptional regulator, regulator of sulfur utilization